MGQGDLATGDLLILPRIITGISRRGKSYVSDGTDVRDYTIKSSKADGFRAT